VMFRRADAPSAAQAAITTVEPSSPFGAASTGVSTSPMQ
jgi:hypothetical protein